MLLGYPQKSVNYFRNCLIDFASEVCRRSSTKLDRISREQSKVIALRISFHMYTEHNDAIIGKPVNKFLRGCLKTVHFFYTSLKIPLLDNIVMSSIFDNVDSLSTNIKSKNDSDHPN